MESHVGNHARGPGHPPETTDHNTDTRRYTADTIRPQKDLIMKKIIIAAILLIAAAGAATPFVSGIYMENVVKESFNDVNAMYAESGSDVSFEILRYDRGFASSRIEWKMNLGALNARNGIGEIVFVDTAKHGIGNIVTRTSLGENRWYTDFVNKELNGVDPLAVETVYQMSGNITSTVALSPFSFNVESETVNILPGKMVVSVDKGLRNILSEMTWEGCTSREKFGMEGFSLNSKLEKISTYIWAGDVAFAMKHLNANDGEKIMDLSNLTCDYKLDYSAEERTLAFGIGYGLEALKTGNGEEAKNAYMRIELNRIDAGGYEALMDVYMPIVQDLLNAIGKPAESTRDLPDLLDRKMAASGFKLIAATEQLLKKGLEVRIPEMKVQLPQGEVKGDLSLRLIRDMTMAQFAPVMMQPGTLLDIFSLESNLSMPLELAGRAANLFSPLYPGMQTGVLIKEGNKAVHRAETKDGKLLLNGKEVLLNI